MAGEIFQTPMQPAAPAVNVANPSGISGADSVAAMAQVRGQNVQKLIADQQSADANRGMDIQQEQDAAVLMENERDRKDRAYYIERSEKAAADAQDLDDKERAIDAEIRQLVLQGGFEERVLELQKQKQDLKALSAKHARTIAGLEAMKAMRDGIFSKDLKDPTGQGIGKKWLDDLLMMADGQREVLGKGGDSIRDWVKRQKEKATRPSPAPVTQAPVTQNPDADFKKKDEIVSAVDDGISQAAAFAAPLPISAPEGGFVRNVIHGLLSGESDLEDEQYERLHPKTPLAEQMGPPSELQNPPGVSYGPSTPEEMGAYRELAEILASYSHGKADPKDLIPMLEAMFNGLEKAVSPEAEQDMRQREGYMKSAAKAYRDLKKAGVDTGTLDNLLAGLKEITGERTTTDVKGAELSAGEATKEPKDKVQNGTPQQSVEKVTAFEKKLNHMMGLLEHMSDDEEVDPKTGQKTNGRLVKAFGDRKFWDHTKGQSDPWMEDMIFNTMAVMSGTANLSEFVTLLTDNDPNNDPSGTGFIKDLDPQVRKLILARMTQAAQNLESERSRWDGEGVKADTPYSLKAELLRQQEEEAARIAKEELQVEHEKKKFQMEQEAKRAPDREAARKKYRKTTPVRPPSITPAEDRLMDSRYRRDTDGRR